MTEDDVSLRIKEEIELHNIEKQYSLIIKFYNMMFFGNGIYWQIPVGWAILCLIGTFAEMIVGNKGFSSLFFISLGIEAVVNLYFGFKYTAEQQLTKMIYYYQKKYDLDSNRVIIIFNYGSILNLVFICVVTILTITNIGMANGDTSVPILAMVINAVIVILSDFVVIGASIYLCIMWCLQMYILQLAYDTYFLNHLIKIDQIGLEGVETRSLHPASTMLTQYQRTSSSRSNKILSPFHRETDYFTNDSDGNDQLIFDTKSFIHKTLSWKHLFTSPKSNFPTVLKRKLSHLPSPAKTVNHVNSLSINPQQSIADADEEAIEQQEILFVYDQQLIEKKISFSCMR